MNELNERLFAAVGSGNLAEVETALGAGASLEARNDEGHTALHVAANSGNADVVRMLLDRGANPNAGIKGGNQNAAGRTPLHEAAWTANAPVIALLLQRGANPFLRAAHDLTPLTFAEMRGKRAAATMRKAIAQSSWANETSIHGAVRAGLVDRVRAFLDAGMAVDVQDDDGLTPLHHAVMSDQETVVRLLIDRGADVNARARQGHFPLMFLRDSVEIARMLLAAGAKPNAEWGEGSTVFHYLVAFKTQEVLELALSYGADLAAKSADGRGVNDYMKTNTPKVRAFVRERMGGTTPADSAIILSRAEIKRLPALAQEETFASLAAEIGALVNRRPAPWKKRKGVVYFHDVSIAKYLAPHYGEPPAPAGDASVQVDRLLARLQDEIRARGFTLVSIGAVLDEDGRLPLILLPTTDKYVPLLLTGTNGVNHGHDNDAVITWLMALDKTNPFVVTGCGLDFVDGRFVGEVRDAEALAAQMISFCPDVAGQNPSLGLLPRSRQIFELARELETTRTFGLWWD